ncbi:plasmid partitioning protein RepB C-terminal domain-containing protein [Mesorhizobium abyssinicae]|uniref:Plasmid partitioning protein RepB C-terminal domain-containing protein n=1 Tax=Mesorhizobium abyssinicae TaxID=1209958 RepID=A0ABU5AMV6_9HYPH|nr:plasmid partitioning protein RepB C-terminal domain-containing protein [Mesorhizobium abyssinicae]MDX8538601.1 plasmid partitioning protein RepB C-terminal domain-containing protein [Mesorhizobium abyssinicae]
MTQAEASPNLKSSRHAIHLTGDLREPAGALKKYPFVTTYRMLTDRMRCFTGEANVSRERLEIVVQTFRQLLAVDVFRDLLRSEGFVIMPATLADRIVGLTAPIAEAKPNQTEATSKQLIGGVCAEVLELLQDCVVPPKMFGLLRQVVPSRQIEIAQLMVALGRVKLNTARVLIALSPESQLADPSTPRRQFSGIDAARSTAMAIEFAELSQEFRNAAERWGSSSLELVAARGYINRLMDSPKVVRYLAHRFPEKFAAFQQGLETTPRFPVLENP